MDKLIQGDRKFNSIPLTCWKPLPDILGVWVPGAIKDIIRARVIIPVSFVETSFSGAIIFRWKNWLADSSI